MVADARSLAAGDEERGALEVVEAAIVQPAGEEVHGEQTRTRSDLFLLAERDYMQQHLTRYNIFSQCW